MPATKQPLKRWGVLAVNRAGLAGEGRARRGEDGGLEGAGAAWNWAVPAYPPRAAMASALSPVPKAPRGSEPLLSVVPAPEREPRTGMLLGLLLVAALVPRLAVFPINENLYGDAVARTELAERWLKEPHVIRSFGDGAQQFGPLHLYLVGAALTVVGREHAG